MSKKQAIIYFIMFTLLTLSTAGLAEVSLDASGKDWFNYSPQEKQELVKKICENLSLSADEKTINKYKISIEEFYTSFLQQCGGDKNNVFWKKCLNEPVMGIVFEIVPMTKKVQTNSLSEFSEAEKEVVAFMNYLQEMAFTGEYREGIPKKEIEAFLEFNIDTLAKVYKISTYDVNALMLYARDKKPLPSNYKVPTMPDTKEREWWNKEIKNSVDTCWKHSKYYKKVK